MPSSYLDEVANYIIENIPEAKQAANRGMKKPTKKTVVDGEVSFFPEYFFGTAYLFGRFFGYVGI